jgi:uncharacterized DUF497 family protein
VGYRKGRKESAGARGFVRDGEGGFDDPHHVAADNCFVETDGEQRYQIIGMNKESGSLLVVFVDRSQTETEVLHPISARKAVDYEESIYKDQFR